MVAEAALAAAEAEALRELLRLFVLLEEGRAAAAVAAAALLLAVESGMWSKYETGPEKESSAVKSCRAVGSEDWGRGRRGISREAEGPYVEE